VTGLILFKEAILAKDNYSYNRHQKEVAKKKKQEEKNQRKLDRKNLQAKASPGQASNRDAAGV
jgi:hypothetical protein